MTKEQIVSRLAAIDNQIDELNAERDRLVSKLIELQVQSDPPTLGISVEDGIGADDIFGGT